MKKALIIGVVLIAGCSASQATADSNSDLKRYDSREFDTNYNGFEATKVYDESNNCFFYVIQDQGGGGLQVTDLKCNE